MFHLLTTRSYISLLMLWFNNYLYLDLSLIILFFVLKNKIFLSKNSLPTHLPHQNPSPSSYIYTQPIGNYIKKTKIKNKPIFGSCYIDKIQFQFQSPNSLSLTSFSLLSSLWSKDISIPPSRIIAHNNSPHK